MMTAQEKKREITRINFVLETTKLIEKVLNNYLEILDNSIGISSSEDEILEQVSSLLDLIKVKKNEEKSKKEEPIVEEESEEDERTVEERKNRRLYLQFEDEIIMEELNSPVEELANLLGRSESSVLNRKKILITKIKNSCNPIHKKYLENYQGKLKKWTAEEDEILLNNTADQASKLLNRSEAACIVRKTRVNKIKRAKDKRLEEEILREAAEFRRNNPTAVIPPSSIKKKPIKVIAKNASKEWESWEDKILLNSTMSLDKIAKKLGRSYGACASRRSIKRAEKRSKKKKIDRR
jgi:hypothetical protein